MSCKLVPDSLTVELLALGWLGQADRWGEGGSVFVAGQIEFGRCGRGLPRCKLYLVNRLDSKYIHLDSEGLRHFHLLKLWPSEQVGGIFKMLY